MTSARDHERYQRNLEKQLRADAELLYSAYLTKLRAYETVHGLRGDAALDLLPASDLPLTLPPAALPPVAAASLPAPAATPVPAPAPRRSGANALYNAICDAMEKLPDSFDRHDVEAALGFSPRRASLYRVLEEMAIEGSIALVSRGQGIHTNRYRKLSAAHSQTASGAE